MRLSQGTHFSLPFTLVGIVPSFLPYALNDDPPAQMARLMNPERGHTVKLIRSPERVMGLWDDEEGRSAQV